MSYIKPTFANDEIYHVVSRAVGDTVVYVDESDFYRGIFSIYEFNNSKKVEIWERRRARKRFKNQEKESVGCRTSHQSEYLDGREKLVEVLAFSFMPNHLHLILRQLKDNGITEFMKKVNGGYANYFNKKYKRMGHLFNKFRAVHIEDDDQLRSAFLYVHANLISMVEPGWKEKGIKNYKKVIKFLENNKRHSYMDYIGKNAFPSVTQRDFFLEFMGGSEGCRAGIDNWIKTKNKLDFEEPGLE
ncbi:MAG: transposase [Candidatus Staskawiczbacteria bacterium]|nr:transposase [Candidatus Staskawiczbacteria bacterium]